MAYLRHWFNGKTVNIFQLSDEVILGRHPDCHIQVDDATVSARHARVFAADGGYRIEDLGSTNGIRFAGEAVAGAPLTDGTGFMIGTQEFQFLETLPDNLDKTLKIKKSWIPGVFFTR